MTTRSPIAICLLVLPALLAACQGTGGAEPPAGPGEPADAGGGVGPGAAPPKPVNLLGEQERSQLYLDLDRYTGAYMAAREKGDSRAWTSLHASVLTPMVDENLAELLATGEARIAKLLARHEREQDQVVPRRATLHDVGSGMTHKRIICRMRYVQGKEPHLIARLTHHSQEAVENYLSRYDRVRYCRLQGLTPEQTARALGCSRKLVREYLDIDQELESENGRK